MPTSLCPRFFRLRQGFGGQGGPSACLYFRLRRPSSSHTLPLLPTLTRATRCRSPHKRRSRSILPQIHSRSDHRYTQSLRMPQFGPLQRRNPPFCVCFIRVELPRIFHSVIRPDNDDPEVQGQLKKTGDCGYGRDSFLILPMANPIAAGNRCKFDMIHFVAVA